MNEGANNFKPTELRSPTEDEKRFWRYWREIRESFYFWPLLFKKRKLRLRPRGQAQFYAGFLGLALLVAIPVSLTILILGKFVNNKYLEALTFVAYICSFSLTLAQFFDKIRRPRKYNIVAFTKKESWFSERARDGIDEIFRSNHDFDVRHETIKSDVTIDEQDQELCNHLLTLSRRKDIDAVIIRPIMDQSPLLEARIGELIKQGIFVVLIDVYVDLARFLGDDVDCPCLIYSDDQFGARAIGEFIVKEYGDVQDQVDFLCLAGPLRAAPGRRRARGIFMNLAINLPRMAMMMAELKSWSERDGVSAFHVGIERLRSQRDKEKNSSRKLLIYCGTDMNAYEINRLLESGRLDGKLGELGYARDNVILIGYNGAKEDDKHRVLKAKHVIATVDARPNLQGKLAASLIIERAETNRRMSRVSFPLPPELVDLRLYRAKASEKGW